MIGSGIKRGTAELAVLSVLQDGPLHGYELARRIEQQTNGALRFTLAALYPMLYRMEQQRWIRGSWETSRSEEHTSELQSHSDLVCRLLLEKKKPNPSRNPAGL